MNAIDYPFDAGRGPRGFFSAYDPTTGELVWRQIFEGYGQAGSVVTAGIFSSPAVYMVNGGQFVTVASGGGSAVAGEET